MNLFNRLPGFTRTPAGKERVVLRQLPRAFLLGTLLLAIPSLLVRLVVSTDNALTVTTTVSRNPDGSIRYDSDGHPKWTPSIGIETRIRF